MRFSFLLTYWCKFPFCSLSLARSSWCARKEAKNAEKQQMSILPTTSVKGKDSTDDNEQKKKEDEKNLILDLLKHYSINTLDTKYCKHNTRENNEWLFLFFSSQR